MTRPNSMLMVLIVYLQVVSSLKEVMKQYLLKTHDRDSELIF